VEGRGVGLCVCAIALALGCGDPARVVDAAGPGGEDAWADSAPVDSAADGAGDGNGDAASDPDGVPDSAPIDAVLADARVDAAPPCSTLVLRPTFVGIYGDPTEYSCSSAGVTELIVRSYDGTGFLLNERTVACVSDTVTIDYLPPGDYSFALRATMPRKTSGRVFVAGWHSYCPTPNPCTHPSHDPCRLVCAAVPPCGETVELEAELLCSNGESGGADICVYI
jgi:hypothetical protein